MSALLDESASGRVLAQIDRRTFIGGSDIAALLGMSPWLTPLQLYQLKTGEVADELTEARRKFFARRKRQEPVIAEMLHDEYGIEVERLSLNEQPNRYIDEEFSFLAAEVDFEFRMTPALRERFAEREDFAKVPDGAQLNGEIKTVHPFKAHEWGAEGSEHIPLHYEMQVLHGLGVTRRPAALVAALFGLDVLHAFPVTANEATIDGIRRQAVRFWSNHVLCRMPPPPVNMDDITRLFAKVNGRPVIADEEMMDALANIQKERAIIKGAEAREKDLIYKVADAVCLAWQAMPGTEVEDNAFILYDGAPVCTWKRRARHSIDTKALRAELPELAAKYTRASYYRQLDFVRKG